MGPRCDVGVAGETSKGYPRERDKQERYVNRVICHFARQTYNYSDGLDNVKQIPDDFVDDRFRAVCWGEFMTDPRGKVCVMWWGWKTGSYRLFSFRKRYG